MNNTAKHGLHQLLSKLGDELFNLTFTVTQGLLQHAVNTREEAIDAIIQHSSDAESVLKRKIITKEILFSYLHDCGATVSMPASKHDLIEKVSSLWNCRAAVKSESSTNSTQDLSMNVNTMAYKFCEWFYKLMNSTAPIGAEHFWADACLKIDILSGATEIERYDIVENPHEIVSLLFKIKKSHCLVFNPNLLDGGFKGELNNYGLVRILCCGTLHSKDRCVGVFKQLFMLARDPSLENNWKVKKSQLSLKSQSDIIQPPSIVDSSMTFLESSSSLL